MITWCQCCGFRNTGNSILITCIGHTSKLDKYVLTDIFVSGNTCNYDIEASHEAVIQLPAMKLVSCWSYAQVMYQNWTSSYKLTASFVSADGGNCTVILILVMMLTLWCQQWWWHHANLVQRSHLKMMCFWLTASLFQPTLVIRPWYKCW